MNRATGEQYLKIATKEVDGVAVLKMSGRLTLEEIAVLDKQSKELMARGFDRFVINMIDVRDLSSSGLGKILLIKKTVEARGGALVISEPSAVTDYVIDLAGVKELFHTFRTDVEAIASVKKRDQPE